MTLKDEIVISKANVHNLKNVSLKIPKNTFTVITGPSGSGKSSLAFDTIYVEGQRRYIESLSSYARQFLGQFQPPDVESITGLSPAIAIEQNTNNKNPRSTVGTTTEIFDYLRILFARVGDLYCLETGEKVIKNTPTQIVKKIEQFEEKTKIHILSPLIENKIGNFSHEVSKCQAMGFSRIRVNGVIVSLQEEFNFSKNSPYTIDLVVDRIILKKNITKRIFDSIEYALKLGNGIVKILVGDNYEELIFSEHYMSPKIRKVYPDLEPGLFSFNSPLGACKKCNGLGETKNFIPSLIIKNENLSILNGALHSIIHKNTFLFQMILNIAEKLNVDLSLPYKNISNNFLDLLWHGSSEEYFFSFTSDSSKYEFTKNFPGIINWMEKKFNETTSKKIKAELEIFLDKSLCNQCKGNKLNPIALSTKIAGKNIIEISSLQINNCYKFLSNLNFNNEKKIISEKILKEIKSRLKFLLNVGLDYLTLNRSSYTLSGGESQRIKLATQIGSSLSGVLYVLDEPSIGLHQKDNELLIKTIKSLKELGNTVLVVEHDTEMIQQADYIIDIGPGAGIHGGKIIYSGPLNKVKRNNKSITIQYLKKQKGILLPSSRKKMDINIKLKGATLHNINNLNIDIPLGGLVCLTGVSGSGKSTLIHDILVPGLKYSIDKKLKEVSNFPQFKSLKGLENIHSVIELDQSPIGKSPHSNPATYTGLFTDIRELFSKTPESKIRGYKAGRFSFNIKGGRCEECEGYGVKKVEMHFLPDVYVTCVECNGKRFNQETLSILYKGKDISEILNFTIEESCNFFKNHPRLKRVLSTLNEIGLGYITLGQAANTLSGGEAQRLKLSKELSKMTKGNCLYILDEPTTGLHFQDVEVLLNTIFKLINKGHTVLIIEHNLDIIKMADHIIDLGPGGGNKGGKVVAQGPPEHVIKVKSSLTGQYLRPLLKK